MDLKETGYEVSKVFSEKVSGFSKSIGERQELQKALAYLDKEEIKCLLIHKVSRLGSNTTEAAPHSFSLLLMRGSGLCQRRMKGFPPCSKG
ncbi:recombinase family protein [Rufibacter latericius]|uniref:Recombinase family protein n=2 Tax=Rufibacter latericius TaxID=2487040 RepID=A0A3M9MAJ3_9BACT|nr:recombinase family protein [Rufibacter latericius]RNI22589.1 recombinase family protein [Rufibacter latericius]